MCPSDRRTPAREKRKVLLFGPEVGCDSALYGGGFGGFVRKMDLYLRFFESKRFELVPCFHSVRSSGWTNNSVFRMFRDVAAFVRTTRATEPFAIHILGHYKSATPREIIIIILARAFRLRVVYEMKGGDFHLWYGKASVLYQRMIRYCLRSADVVLCQGIPFVEFIAKEFAVEGVYYPNFVHESEIPDRMDRKLQNNVIRALFVGYAYQGKGVCELVEGCEIASRSVPIELTIIGQEHPEFSKWMEKRQFSPNLTVTRLGRRAHDAVLPYYKTNDLYLYPTRHIGEGHNNSINEAMMHGMVIATTQVGFLGTVLSDDSAYFFPAVQSDEIARVVMKIENDREKAAAKGQRARERLERHFVAGKAFAKLKEVYGNLPQLA